MPNSSKPCSSHPYHDVYDCSEMGEVAQAAHTIMFCSYGLVLFLLLDCQITGSGTVCRNRRIKSGCCHESFSGGDQRASIIPSYRALVSALAAGSSDAHADLLVVIIFLVQGGRDQLGF